MATYVLLLSDVVASALEHAGKVKAKAHHQTIRMAAGNSGNDPTLAALQPMPKSRTSCILHCTVQCDLPLSLIKSLPNRSDHTCFLHNATTPLALLDLRMGKHKHRLPAFSLQGSVLKLHLCGQLLF